MSGFDAFATALLFGLGCFVLGIFATLAVQAFASMSDGEVRR
jgi:hypothetical protein